MRPQNMAPRVKSSTKPAGFERHILAYPKLILALILLVTIFFASKIPSVRMASDFADLLPQQHDYIQLHNEIRDTFGGANNIILSIDVEEGTIFTNEALDLIHRVTTGVDQLPSVNHNLVTSLTHRTTRKVWLNASGGINSDAYYDAQRGTLSPEALRKLEKDVVSNPRVYELLVSPDLKSALVRATLQEGELDYGEIFNRLQELRASESSEKFKIYATGQPVLIGWVSTYVNEIVKIFFLTAAIMLCVLLVYFRRARAVLLPLLGIVLTTIWGLGALSMLGYALDPLMMVVPFLISARAMSHGIQIVERFYQELPAATSSRAAAQSTFQSLFRPGSLGVVSDAIGLALISLGSVPINDKLAQYASLWAFSVIFTVIIMIPAVLCILPRPKVTTLPDGKFRRLAPRAVAKAVGSKPAAKTILLMTVIALMVGGAMSSKVRIGESEPGSPLLYSHHDYNVSSSAINKQFPGSEELFVIVQSTETGGLKKPEVLHAIEAFKRHMLQDPELGAAKGLPDLVKQVNRMLHADDPRWGQIPTDGPYVGGLLFAYMAASPTPDALLEFISPDESTANLVFYYKDRRGETIRRALHMAQTWVDSPAAQIEGIEFKLAGGPIGVTAAINESAYETNLIVIPLVFLLIFVMASLFYRSFHAGLIMFLAMMFATILTYAYMGFKGIGINVNTVPIIAVGIGVGIDYSIYMMDRIREQAKQSTTLVQAVRGAITTTGLAVGVTAITLIGGVVMWVFLSTLRFQADAALLLTMMLIFNAIAAMFVVPAWIITRRPKFITSHLLDADHQPNGDGVHAKQ